METRADREKLGDIDAIILDVALFDVIGNAVTFDFAVNEFNADAVAVAVAVAVNFDVADTELDTVLDNCAVTDDKADIIDTFDIIGCGDTVAIALHTEIIGLFGTVNGETMPVKYAESGAVPIEVKHA